MSAETVSQRSRQRLDYLPWRRFIDSQKPESAVALEAVWEHSAAGHERAAPTAWST
jgi:hypothetical protein